MVALRSLHGTAIAALFALIGLGGCNPSEIVAVPAASGNLVRGADTATNTDTTTYPVILLQTFEGVPQQLVKPLEQSMKSVSPTYGFQVDPTRRMRHAYAFTGNFGAIKEESSNIISYRWTITDGNGNFVYSFLGNLNGSYGTTHPWQGFKETDLRRLANQSMSHFANWLKRKR